MRVRFFFSVRRHRVAHLEPRTCLANTTAGSGFVCYRLSSQTGRDVVHVEGHFKVGLGLPTLYFKYNTIFSLLKTKSAFPALVF